MPPNLRAFANRLCKANLREIDNAVAILYFHAKMSPPGELTPRQIADLLSVHALGRPNVSRLRQNLADDRRTMRGQSEGTWRIRAASMAALDEKWAEWLGPLPPEVKYEFIPREMTDGTRGYIEKAAYQINGCYEAGFYDACAIMIRRLVETLIIEVFEKIGKADIIKGTDGNFFMLPCLLDKLSAEESINLGREAKRVPGKIKKFGDRSAHNRRWNATKSDLDSLKDDTRLLVEELIHLSGLQ